MTITTLEQLYARALPPNENGCIEWQGSFVNEGKYPIVAFDGEVHKVHRLAYMLAHNVTLSMRQDVRRTCKNNTCIKAEHLVMSMDANTNAKLTEHDVLEARRRYAAGESAYALAKYFGVGGTTMRKLLARITWHYLKPDPEPELERRPKSE
jgi:hypothetical protein